MNQVVEQLMEQVAVCKRGGQFEKAINHCKEAIVANPKHYDAYVQLGQVAYLAEMQDLSLRSYLAALHLQLYPIQKALEKKALPQALKQQFDLFPKEMRDSFPKESAGMIYLDPTVVRHLGHTVIDLNQEFLELNPQLVPYSHVYCASLLEETSYTFALTLEEMTEEEQKEVEKEVYMSIGRKIALERLNWNQLDSFDVVSLYF